MKAFAERLHVTLLWRFLADCLHLAGSLGGPSPAPPAAAAPASGAAPHREPADSGTWPALSPAAPLEGADDAAEAAAVPLVRLELRDLRVDLPRRSDGSDFLSLAVGAAEVVAPASRAHLAAALPDMDE